MSLSLQRSISKKKRCKGHPEETLIEIDQADYKELSIKSAINCNDVKHRAKADLVKMVDKHRVSFHKSPIPNDLPKTEDRQYQYFFEIL